MRKVAVFRDGVLAGELIKVSRRHYVFRYDESYFYDINQPAISVTLPKTIREHQSETLFPFFSNMVAEGANRAIQEKYMKIDKDDTFRLLEATAGNDTIGAVTVMPIVRP